MFISVIAVITRCIKHENFPFKKCYCLGERNEKEFFISDFSKSMLTSARTKLNRRYFWPPLYSAIRLHGQVAK